MLTGYPALADFFEAAVAAPARVEQLVSNGVIMAPLIREGARPLMVRMTRIGSRFERQDLFEVPYIAAERGLSKAL